MLTTQSLEYPLPPAQAAILRHPPSANCLLSVSFGRAMDRARWRQAWMQLVQLHPILRTSFRGTTLQEFAWSEHLPFAWSESDWQQLPREEIAASWNELQATEEKLPFDPSLVPLWRVHFLLLPEGVSHLLLTLHPALCDETAATNLLVAWLNLYDSPAAADQPLLPLPGISAAHGSLDLEENPRSESVEALFQNLCPESASPAECMAWSGAAASTETLAVDCSVHPNFIDKIRRRAEELEATPREIASLLWGAFWAHRTHREESLSLVPLDLRPFLAPEHREVLGHLTAPLLWRQRFTPSEGDPWWRENLPRLRQAREHLFSPWAEAAAEYGRAQGLTVASRLPGVLLRWCESSLNDNLHTALPRWLSVDARWTEPPAVPLEVRLHATRSPRAELLLEPGWLPAHCAEKLLQEFLLWGENFLGNASRRFLCAPLQSPEGFRLDAEPTLGDRLEAALQKNETLPLAEYGETRLTAGEMAAFSNQLARHLRKNRPPEGTRFLVCLQPGFFAGLTALTLVRENWDAVWIEPGLETTDPVALAASLQAGCLLLDSTTQEVWAGSDLRQIIVDTDWEKIAAQATTPPTARKRQRPAQWEFRSASSVHATFGEASLGVSVRSILQDWFPGHTTESDSAVVSVGGEFPDTPPRLLATGTPGHPWILEEILVAALGGAVLVWRDAELFSTRSAFQEHLQAGAITHLLLPSARFADWVHFLVELQQPLPSSLACVVLRSGHLGRGVLAAWFELAGEKIVTRHLYAPLGLAGLCLGGPMTPSSVLVEQTPCGLHPLGQPRGGVVVICASCSNHPLPTGSLGQMVWQLPDDALTDGVLEREFRPPLQTVELANQTFWGFPSADFPAEEWPQAPRRIRAAVETCYLSHPQIFDGITTLSPEARRLSAWLVPVDSGSQLPRDLGPFLRQGMPEGWALDQAAAMAKWPVFADGTLQLSALPPPTNLPEPPPAEVAARPSSAVAATASPAEPAPLLEFLLPAAADKPLLLLHGELIQPGTTEAVIGQAGAEWSVALSPQWGDSTWELLQQTPARERLLVASGTAVWDLVRWAARSKNSAAAFHFLLVSPCLESPTEGMGRKVRGWWERLRGGPVGGNTRREAGTPQRSSRPLPWDGPARILLSAQPTTRLISFFPAGEFFIGDLSSADSVAGALFDILRNEVESESITTFAEESDPDAPSNKSPKPTESKPEPDSNPATGSPTDPDRET